MTGWYKSGLHSLWVIYDTTRWFQSVVSISLGKSDVDKVMVVMHGIGLYSWYDDA